ncbi:MAG: M56 family metallopeptidase, partial [Bacteroidota bacterium]
KKVIQKRNRRFVMEYIIINLLKTSVSLILLFLIYKLLFQRVRFFEWNRAYLLGSIIFSLILPFISFSNASVQEIASSNSYTLNAVTVEPGQIIQSSGFVMNYVSWIIGIYVAGLLFYFLLFIIKLIRISAVVKKFGVVMHDGIPLVIMDNDHAPFSFFKWVFINKNLSEEDLKKIIDHELVHTEQKHTLDMILIELISASQWFNPVVRMYRKSLQEVHEYLADEGVLKKGYEKSSYQELLLTISLNTSVSGLTNNFNRSLIKRRIIMMTKQKQNGIAKLMYLIAIPAALLLMISFTSPVQISGSSVNNNGLHQSLPIAPEGDVTMPEYPGGPEAMSAFMLKNIVYPKKAKENNITGKVMIDFVVDKTGKVKDVTVKKSVDPELDAEALRVIKMMPNWKPGKKDGQPIDIQLTLPVSFKLEDKKK